MNKNNLETLQILLRPDQKEYLRKKEYQTKVSMSEQIRRMIDLSKEKEGELDNLSATK